MSHAWMMETLAAMVPMGFGAGIGRVGEFYEQGNFYRGGSHQMLMTAWLYDYGFIETFKHEFKELPFEEIAFPRGCKLNHDVKDGESVPFIFNKPMSFDKSRRKFKEVKCLL